MGKRLLVVFLFITPVFSCKSDDCVVESVLKIIKENENAVSSGFDIGVVADKKYRLRNIDYYYPLARYYIKNFGIDTNGYYLINKAIETGGIFKNEAIRLLIFTYIDESKFGTLKKAIKKYELFIDEKYKKFLKNYAMGKKFEYFEDIPPDLKLLGILNDIAKNDSDFFTDKNVAKLNRYLISLGKELYSDEFKRRLYNCEKLTKNAFLMKSLFFYFNKDSAGFTSELGNILQKVICPDEMKIIKKISIDLGSRSAYFNELTRIYGSKQGWTRFFILEEIYNREGHKVAIPHYEATLADFKNESGYINYNLRQKILYHKNGFSADWLEKVISFHNDYANSFHARSLLNLAVRSAIYQKKTEIFLRFVDKIDFESMSYYDRTSFFYTMYLIDKKNRQKWLNYLSEYNFSYGILNIDGGIKNIPFGKGVKLEEISAKGKEILKKVAILLKFDLREDIDSYDLSDISKSEKYIIDNELFKYYQNREDYYSAVKYAIKRNEDFYGINYDGITYNDFKDMYPLHFYDFVKTYSEVHNVDPALVYAVMREESRYQKDVVSRANAVGLMQIMPETGKFIADKIKIKSFELTRAEDNINMGSYYLNHLRYFFDDLPLILSCYNAGPGRTRQWYRTYKAFPKELIYELIPIEETRNYIRKVMKSYYIYKYILERENILFINQRAN